MALDARQQPYAVWALASNTILRRQKLRPQSVTSRVQPGGDVIVCADGRTVGLRRGVAPALAFTRMTELRKTVVAHVFGERTMATLGRLIDLLSPLTW